MAGNVMPQPKAAFFDDNGAPLAGGFLYTYQAGTTTPLDTYTTSALDPASANANPVELDARGEATIYLSPVAYKFKLTDADGVVLWTQDAVTALALSTDTTTNTASIADHESRLDVLEALSIVTTGGTQTLTAKTLTSPIINTPTVKDLTEVVTATNVITAAETGSTFFLNSATEFVSTLPAVAAGLRFTFIVSAAPSGASYTVVAASGTPIVGHVVCSQDAGGTADSETSGVLTVTFVDSKAVKGDRADFICDGTNWFVRATCKVFDAITLS